MAASRNRGAYSEAVAAELDLMRQPVLHTGEDVLETRIRETAEPYFLFDWISNIGMGAVPFIVRKAPIVAAVPAAAAAAGGAGGAPARNRNNDKVLVAWNAFTDQK